MRLKLLIFDLDGTLIDSHIDIAFHLNRVLKDLGRKQIDHKRIKGMIGSGARKLIENLFPEHQVEIALELFRKYYMKEPVIYTEPYEGIEELLEFIKTNGKRITVVTNKSESLSKEILRRLELHKHIDLLVGGDTFQEKKPSPLPILKVLEYFGLHPKDAMMVGDTDADIVAGKEAGVWTTLAEWGYSDANGTKPDFFVSEPKGLISLLEKALS